MTMGRQNIIDKAIHPLTTITQITPAGVIPDVARAGVIPIGNYKGVPAFWDLDKAVNQPLIWAEKQWTEDVVDSRDGISTVIVPIAAPLGVPVVAPVGARIIVPAGQIWYLVGMSLYVHQAVGMTGTLALNLLVSSFPKVAVTGADKPYYDVLAVGDGRQRLWEIANADIIGAPEAARTRFSQFQAGDELGVPLRAVGGDTFSVVATPDTAPVGVAAVTCDLTLYGRKAKMLVA